MLFTSEMMTYQPGEHHHMMPHSGLEGQDAADYEMRLAAAGEHCKLRIMLLRAFLLGPHLSIDSFDQPNTCYFSSTPEFFVSVTVIMVWAFN